MSEAAQTLTVVIPLRVKPRGGRKAMLTPGVLALERRQDITLIKAVARAFRWRRLPEEQLLFAFEEIEATLAENVAVAGKVSPALRDHQAKRRREGRGRLPAHLPRVEVVLAPEATACPCCRGPMVEIGVDAAERLDVIPAQFRVVVTAEVSG